MAMQFGIHGRIRLLSGGTLLAATLVLAACDENVVGPGEGTPAPVSWMSWIGGINATERATVHMLGTRSGCAEFRISVLREGTRIRIVPEELVMDRPCLARDFLMIYDTTITLPGLGEGVYTIEALTYGPAGIATRGFGTLSVAESGVFDALLHAAGHAYMLPDSLGCSWMRQQVHVQPVDQPVVLQSNVTLPAGWQSAFVGGSYLQGTARCGQTQHFVLAFSEIMP